MDLFIKIIDSLQLIYDEFKKFNKIIDEFEQQESRKIIRSAI